jgi:hypothetical protein
VPEVQSSSGDHLKTGRNDVTVVEADVPARQAVTGHHVRVVLLCSVLGAALALAAVYVVEFL